MNLQRANPEIPFVGLHAHSVAGSLFDALGYPAEHMDFAYENGMEALALTDHGNANGLAYQVLHAKKMRAEGKKFKPIFGCEAYFIPSIANWKKDYDKVRETAKNKSSKKDLQSGATVEDEQNKKLVKSILNKRSHMILLAQNQTGLKNIFKMISKSYSSENFYRYPRMDYALLKKHAEGVIAASACLGGVYAGDFWQNREKGEDAVLDAMRLTTQKMQSIFGKRWFGELQWNNVPEQHKLNTYIIQMHHEFGVELISTADSHYYSPDVWKDRELYKRLGFLGKRPEWMSEELPDGVEEIGYELYPKNGDQMWESYKKYSKECGFEYDDNLVLNSIKRTHSIAFEDIDSFLPDNTVRLPDMFVPDGFTPAQALARLSIEGARIRGFVTRTNYIERLKQEVKIIDSRGFSKYFLTMKAISDRATDRQLVGAGRGSAAGSLVAYALGITQIDPIKYGLQFERFLTKGGSGYPDIDYDVADPMTLKEQLIEEWGDNMVVPITNWNTLQLRSLLKDISKFYGVPFTEVNDVTSKMIFEATPLAKKEHGITAGVYNPTFDELMKFSDSLKSFLKKYPQIETHVNKLYGQTRSASRHAGGVVIGENLDQWMPLINSGGVRQTPWSEGQNVRHLEPMGFIKFDILGLASLRMIEDAISHILKRYHGYEVDPTFEDIKKFYEENLHPEKIDLEDEQVWEHIFHEGKWAGIFQFTEAGAQTFCKQAKPNNITDLAAITSIYRPGPLSAGVDKMYIGAKEEPEEVEYLNEQVRDVTEETYGFLIFQEQIAMLAHKLGRDLSLDEGNKLRKLLTKKGTGSVDEEKDKIYNKFRVGCIEKGMKPYEAKELWDKFEYFSGYGFNKSHAVSYCVLSFQCAYLLHYYPECWLAAFLDKEPDKRKERAINIAKSYGYKIEPLNVNTSGITWEISEDGKTLIQPLSSIKGLGMSAIKQILDNRPFSKIEEFIFNDNMVYSKLNKKSLDALIRSQALNCLMDKRFSGLKHFWSAVAVQRPRKEKNLLDNIEQYRDEGDFSEEEKLQYLVDLTGFFPINLVVNEHIQRRLDELYVPPISEFDESLQVVWFIPREVVKKKTKNGKDFYIVKVIDSNSEQRSIKCWGVKPDKDKVYLNRPYMAKLDWHPQWGFSTRAVSKTFKLLA